MPSATHRWLSRTLPPLVALTCWASCGGRTLFATLDDDDGMGGSASTDAGGAGGMGASGAGGIGGSGGAGPDTSSTGPGSGPIECLTCIGESCPEAIGCVTNPDCIQGLVCTVSQCLGGGGQPDFMCVLDCFNGDLEAAFSAIQAITCIFGDCANECGDLLGGFPGGGFPGP